MNDICYIPWVSSTEIFRSLSRVPAVKYVKKTGLARSTERATVRSLDDGLPAPLPVLEEETAFEAPISNDEINCAFGTVIGLRLGLGLEPTAKIGFGDGTLDCTSVVETVLISGIRENVRPNVSVTMTQNHAAYGIRGVSRLVR